MNKIIILTLSKLFLFTILVNAKPLEELNLKLKIIENKYQITDKYEAPAPLPFKEKKEADSHLNVDADVNKDTKQLDSLKIDMGKKF